ncbi:MAG TPA: pyruvoyl-dependent arginine decarboxylase [Candidatus Saccharimonadales bacterium]
MNIQLASGIGTGPTTLAAFDAALNITGIANYNILCLSSVIPPNSKVTIQQSGTAIPPSLMPGGWGDRLYVVMAEHRVDTPNVEAWAGIGWVQDPETNKGLFVEHEGESETAVRRDIEDSLNALMKTRGIDFSPIHMEVTGGICTGTPICAMVVAVYQSSDWQNNATLIS